MQLGFKMLFFKKKKKKKKKKTCLERFEHLVETSNVPDLECLMMETLIIRLLYNLIIKILLQIFLWNGYIYILF
jgi:hypothetical protein